MSQPASGSSAHAAPDPSEPAADLTVIDHLAHAAGVAHAGSEVPDAARLRPLRKLLATGASPLLNFQVAFNQHLLAAAEQLAERQAHDARQLAAALTDAQARIAALEHDAAVRRDELDALRAALDTLASRVDRAGDAIADLDTAHAALLQASTNSQRPAAQPGEAGDTSGPADAGAAGHQITTDQRERQLDARQATVYRNLELTFRGSPADVQQLLAVYLPEVKATGGPVVDIGCGRGEWLDLLRDAEVPAYGVDLNDTFVADNRERGLDVRHGDAIEHLRGLDAGTLGAVTGFHIAEHLPFDTLLDLLDASRRALRPGGVLILESPNPQNLVIGAANFWLDPTHIRPLHPLLLEFMARQRGYASTELRWLHPHQMSELPFLEGLPDTDANRQVLRELSTRLFGPMDFALVARRAHGDGDGDSDSDQSAGVVQENRAAYSEEG